MIFTCNVIDDLLPLYADGICSEDTKTVVERHAAECEECRKKLEAMASETLKEKNIGETTFDKHEKRYPENPFKKVKRHYTRLIAITLLICTVILLPAAGAFVLTVNEQYDRGYSWAEFKAERELKRFADMIKRGDYRNALDVIKIAYEDSYSAEKISLFKDMYAEDMKQYFEKYPIKKIRIETDDGRCDNAYVKIYLENTSFSEDAAVYQSLIFLRGGSFGSGNGSLYAAGNMVEMENYNDYSQKIYYELNSGFPQLNIIPRNMTSNYFDNIKNGDYHRAAYMLQTDRYWNLDARLKEKADKKGCMPAELYIPIVEEQMKSLFSDYKYVGCEDGDVTYERGAVFTVLFLDSESVFDRYYLQHAKLTVCGKDGAEFYVSLDVPFNVAGSPWVPSNVRNITYSENTPDDFKVRFEEIFA